MDFIFVTMHMIHWFSWQACFDLQEVDKHFENTGARMALYGSKSQWVCVLFPLYFLLSFFLCFRPDWALLIDWALKIKYPSIYLSIYSIYLSICLPICLSLFVSFQFSSVLNLFLLPFCLCLCLSSFRLQGSCVFVVVPFPSYWCTVT